MIFNIIVLSLSVIAGVGIWFFGLNFLLSFEETGFLDSVFNNPLVPAAALLIIFVCYFFARKYLLRRGRDILFNFCMILSFCSFILAPQLIGVGYFVVDEIHRVYPSSNEKFLNSIQADIDKGNMNYRIDYLESKVVLKRIKTMYVAVLIKTDEGRVTEDEINFFLAREYNKRVNLRFYTSNKDEDSSIELYLTSKNKIDSCYPAYVCGFLESN